jgi:hypothetical protein
MARDLGIPERNARKFLEKALPRSPEDRRRAQGTPTKYRIGECGRVTADRRRPVPQMYRCPCGNRSLTPTCITCQQKHAA